MNTILRKLYTPMGVLLIFSVFVGLYLGVLYPWMNEWGATDAEVEMALPEDPAKPGQITTSTRGVTVQAPAAEVWKWVVQLGQERAGFYSNDWLENLTLAGIHNANEIRPEWQQRLPGDRVLGAGGAVYGENFYWPVTLVEDGKMLYLWGPIVVIPVNEHSSRLVVRTYAMPPSLPGWVISAFSYDWMHFVMERGMLLGIQARAEGRQEVSPIIQVVSGLGWLAATLATGWVLFARRRGWWWGLFPLLYAGTILYFTQDLAAAAAGFCWWGIVAGGFLLWGRTWWKGLALTILAVILIFVIFNQPHPAFGCVFLLMASWIMAIRNQNRPAEIFVQRLRGSAGRLS